MPILRPLRLPSRLAAFVLLLVSALPHVHAAESARPIVVTSTTILDDFVRTLGADAIDARCLLTPGRDPHSFEPTPADVRQLARADLIIVNGLGFELWLDKTIKNSGTRARVLAASQGIEPLHVPHDHHHHDHDHDHAHHHHHGDIDPHAWHDLRLAARYVENISAALARLAPDSANAINARAALYLSELEKLDTRFRETLSAIPAGRRKLVTSHDSLRYLGRAYNLTIIPIAGLGGGQEPSARELAAIVKTIRAENARVLFLDATTNPKIPTLLAREAGVTIVSELYTDSLGAHGTPGATFLGMARTNLETLATALR